MAKSIFINASSRIPIPPGDPGVTKPTIQLKHQAIKKALEESIPNK